MNIVNCNGNKLCMIQMRNFIQKLKHSP